jgi:hypothetical protein
MKSRTHKLFVALPSKRDNGVKKWLRPYTLQTLRLAEEEVSLRSPGAVSRPSSL